MTGATVDTRPGYAIAVPNGLGTSIGIGVIGVSRGMAIASVRTGAGPGNVGIGIAVIGVGRGMAIASIGRGTGPGNAGIGVGVAVIGVSRGMVIANIGRGTGPGNAGVGIGVAAIGVGRGMAIASIGMSAGPGNVGTGISVGVGIGIYAGWWIRKAIGRMRPIVRQRIGCDAMVASRCSIQSIGESCWAFVAWRYKTSHP